MQCVLAVVDDRESGNELLAEVGSVASGTDSEVIVVSLITESEYHEDITTLQQIGEIEQTSYDESPRRFAQNLASTLAKETLGDDVQYRIIGDLVESDEQADRILSIADDHGCDHIFLTGKRRSPTGKALFGDRAQKVLLNFDEYVTVNMLD